MFLLDTLDNLPRLRILKFLMKVILWILRETGAHDVPSFDRLQTVQKKLRQCSGTPTVQFTSAQGNIVYMNDPVALICQVGLILPILSAGI